MQRTLIFVSFLSLMGIELSEDWRMQELADRKLIPKDIIYAYVTEKTKVLMINIRPEGEQKSDN